MYFLTWTFLTIIKRMKKKDLVSKDQDPLRVVKITRNGDSDTFLIFFVAEVKMTMKAEYLVVDSGGFLKNAPLRDLANNLVTLTDVVGEIRDRETRQRLEVMPLDISYRQPSAEAVKKVSDFARKTGDYASLSAVDIR